MGKKNKLKPTYVDFDHKNYKWKSDIDYRITRSRRYYNHSSGTKWTQENGEWKVLPFDRNEKRFLESSDIFKSYWKIAREDTRYLKMKKKFKKSKNNA